MMNRFKFILCFVCIFSAPNAYADNCDTPNNDLTVPASNTYNGDVDGYCNVTISSNAQVQNGGINADGNVSLTVGSKVANDITAGGNVLIEGGTVQNGNVSADGDITLKNGALVNNNVTSGSSIIIEDSTVQNGSVSADGDITLNDGASVPNGDVVADGIVNLSGIISKQNGKICGKSGVDGTDLDDASNISEDKIFVGEDCDQLWDGSPPILDCDVPPDLSNYKIEDGDFSLGNRGEYTVASEYDGLYVNGTVTLGQRSVFNGNIYATGNVELKNSATVNGTVYSEGLIDLKQFSQITEGQCPGITPPSSDDYYFEIVTLSDALTCEPHDVQINVKNSDDDSLFSDFVGSISLAVTPARGTWSGGGDGLTDSGNNDGSASYQFTSSDQGSVALGLSYSTAGTLTIDVGDGIGASDSADISFYTSLIKTELSCVDTVNDVCINTANLPFTLTMTAVKKNEETTLCESYDPEGIKFWSEYETPSAPNGDSSVEIKVESASTYSVIGKSETDATEFAVTFSDGVAVVNANYPDAGKIGIHLKDSSSDDIPGEASLIVNPLELQVSDIDDNPAQESDYDYNSGDGFMRAAVRNYDGAIEPGIDNFDITVRAVIDCSEDPLGHCSGSDNPTAESFENDISLGTSLVFPTHTSATLGSIHSEGGENELTELMSDGELTFSALTYDEVGVVAIQATSVDYIESENDVDESSVKEVGRFYPAYIAYDDHSYSAGCVDFTYMTEDDADTPISGSAVTLSYVMQAKAQASSGETEQVTENYHYDSDADPDNYDGYPVAADFVDTTYSNNSLLDVSDRIVPADYYDETNWSQGGYTLTELDIGLQKSSTDIDGPYFEEMPIDDSIDDQLEYYIQLTGIDGEKLQTAADTECSSDLCRLPSDGGSSLGDFAYGRLQAGNGHGSEFQSIRTLIEATYFNGVEFVPFNRDSCTPILNEQLSATPDMDSSNNITVGTGQTTLSILNSPLISGKGYLQFSAPDDRGTLDYFIRLKDLADSGIYLPWLLDSGNAVTCPDETGALTDCISGYVEFGLYRGNDRVIYRMQTFD